MLVLAVFIFVVSLFYLLYRATRHDYWERRHVKIAPGAHWLLGHYKPMFTGTKYIADVYMDIYNSFPDEPYVGYMRVFTPGLVIRDPDLVKSVLTTDFSSFAKNEMTVNKKVDCLFGSNPFVTAGEEWKSSRAHMSPLVTYAKLKGYLGVMRSMGQQLVKHIKDAQNEGGVAEFETRELGGKYTTDVVSNAVLGVNNDTFANPNSLFSIIAHELFTGELADHIKIMSSFAFPFLGKWIGLRFSSKKSEKILLGVTRKMMSQTGEHDGLFQQMKQYKLKDKAGVLTDEYIASHAYGFLLDGTETSSDLLCFTLFELAWHSDVQERLRKEIMDMVSRTRGECSVDDIENLNYLHMVLSEALRMHPPLGMLSKICTSDYFVSHGERRLLIQKGTPIQISVCGLHMDPKYFPNPTKFDPERYTDEAVAERHKFVYLPFGDGPRRCVGQRYGYLQTKCAIVDVLTHFLLKPSSKSPYPIEKDPSLWIGRPLNGAWINFENIKTS